MAERIRHAGNIPRPFNPPLRLKGNPMQRFPDLSTLFVFMLRVFKFEIIVTDDSRMYWEISEVGGICGSGILAFDGTYWTVRHVEISKHLRGRGLYGEIIQSLRKEYGPIASDHIRSPSASRAWEKIPGVKLEYDQYILA